jgi:hypothetical protein
VVDDVDVAIEAITGYSLMCGTSTSRQDASLDDLDVIVVNLANQNQIFSNCDAPSAIVPMIFYISPLETLTKADKVQGSLRMTGLCAGIPLLQLLSAPAVSQALLPRSTSCYLSSSLRSWAIVV